MKAAISILCLGFVFAIAGCDPPANETTMKLNICDEREISSPSTQDIRDAVLGLDASGDAFLILGPTDMTYIQCSGDRKIGLDLEFQEESIDDHYRAKRNDWDGETIITKFSQYAKGDMTRKEDVEWEKITW